VVLVGPLTERTGPDWPSVTGIDLSVWPSQSELALLTGRHRDSLQCLAPLIGRTGPDWPAVTGTAGPHKERTGLDGPAGRHRIAGPLIQ